MSYTTELLPQTLAGLEQYVRKYNQLIQEIIEIRNWLEMQEKDYDVYLYKYSDNNSSLRVVNYSRKRMNELKIEISNTLEKLHNKEKEIYHHSHSHQVYRYDYLNFISKGLELPADRKFLYN